MLHHSLVYDSFENFYCATRTRKSSVASLSRYYIIESNMKFCYVAAVRKPKHNKEDSTESAYHLSVIMQWFFN